VINTLNIGGTSLSSKLRYNVTNLIIDNEILDRLSKNTMKNIKYLSVDKIKDKQLAEFENLEYLHCHSNIYATIIPPFVEKVYNYNERWHTSLKLTEAWHITYSSFTDVTLPCNIHTLGLISGNVRPITFDTHEFKNIQNLKNIYLGEFKTLKYKLSIVGERLIVEVTDGGEHVIPKFENISVRILGWHKWNKMARYHRTLSMDK